MPRAQANPVSKPNFNISISPYEGDPETLNFFVSQIKEISNFNSWSPAQTVTFFKSKLSGSALKFFIENASLHNVLDLDQIIDAFSKFFRKKSPSAALVEYENLALLPGESITNLGHRLSKLATSVFPNIKDPSDLDQIKLVKLKAILPSFIRIKLLDENIFEFDKAVQKAQLIQDNYAEDNVLSINAKSSSSVLSLVDEVAALRDEIKSMKNKPMVNTLESSDNSSRQPHNSKFQKNNSRHFSSAKGHVRNNFSSSNSFFKGRGNFVKSNSYKSFQPRSSSNFHPNSVPVCYFCGRRGHFMKFCRDFQNQGFKNPQFKQNFGSCDNGHCHAIQHSSTDTANVNPNHNNAPQHSGTFNPSLEYRQNF